MERVPTQSTRSGISINEAPADTTHPKSTDPTLTRPDSLPHEEPAHSRERSGLGRACTERSTGDRDSLADMASRTNALDLKSIWLFSGCSGSELRKIRSSLDEVTVPQGKVLVEEGRVGLEFFLIVEGTATVTRNGKKVATLGPSGYFGELALLDRKPRSASVVSDTDMNVLVLSQHQFNSLLQSVPTIARKLLAAMAQRVREADAKAFD